MPPQLIECVPNFSEGRDPEVIRRITDAIESVEGVRLLDVDPGRATHRTVVTFVGPPADVVEAAVRGARRAAELIDMRRHRGEHPRFGALDVCPLVPVSGITMEETVAHARELARRLGEEVGLTVYCYEHAAFEPGRRNLADIRAGEYEGLAAKLARPEWKPDFGPAELDPRSGATAVGARDFLIAYNVNLNTTSVRRANAVAVEVREKGKVKRENGKVVRDAEGKRIYEPGALKGVKAIGWFIEEYGVAQISMNLTDVRASPIHVAFEEVRRRAAAKGMRVTGSEIVGLVPLAALLDAGRYFLARQQRSLGVSDRETLKIAVKSLGLDDLEPFVPEEKIIEYAMRKGEPRGLTGLTVRELVEETASESPAPGGGSVAATSGALGAALGAMVANLSAHKRGWEERWEEFSQLALEAKGLHDALLELVEEDTWAFDGLMAALRLPRKSDEEKEARQAAIQEATWRAMEVPFRIAERAHASLAVLEAVAEEGNPASVTDAGVGALCARAAVRGALLNVRVNAAGLEDAARGEELLRRGRELEVDAEERERRVLEIVDRRL